MDHVYFPDDPTKPPLVLNDKQRDALELCYQVHGRVLLKVDEHGRVMSVLSPDELEAELQKLVGQGAKIELAPTTLDRGEEDFVVVNGQRMTKDQAVEVETLKRLYGSAIVILDEHERVIEVLSPIAFREKYPDLELP